MKTKTIEKLQFLLQFAYNHMLANPKLFATKWEDYFNTTNPLTIKENKLYSVKWDTEGFEGSGAFEDWMPTLDESTEGGWTKTTSHVSVKQWRKSKKETITFFSKDEEGDIIDEVTFSKEDKDSDDFFNASMQLHPYYKLLFIYMYDVHCAQTGTDTLDNIFPPSPKFVSTFPKFEFWKAQLYEYIGADKFGVGIRSVQKGKTIYLPENAPQYIKNYLAITYKNNRWILEKITKEFLREAEKVAVSRLILKDQLKIEFYIPMPEKELPKTPNYIKKIASRNAYKKVLKLHKDITTY